MLGPHSTAAGNLRPSMYLSADDARSDFFLAAALYVIGPSLVALLVGGLPGVFASRVGLWFLGVVVPLLTTAAMPLYLMRYRGEPLSGLLAGGGGSAATGLLVAVPLVVGVAVGEVIGGGQVALLGDVGGLVLLSILVRWGSLAVLAVFLWRRAEYAFRPFSEAQSLLTRRAGMASAATVGVSTVLLLLDARPVLALLPAAGLAAVYLLAERLLPQEGMGERWWAWAPAITLALGPLELLSLFFGGASFLTSAQQAAGVALFGLVVTMALHARRGGALAFGLAAGFAVSNLLALSGGTGFIV